ncbi:MAG: prolyl oligopeptidase family serine peptidase, partial [Nannocystaceae bacterium]
DANDPDTAEPAGVTEIEVPYEPSQDPDNSRLGGVDLRASRDPENRADARKKAFTIAALYKLKAVGDPQWSPDGSRIVFAVTSYNVAKGTQNRDIYRIQRDGSQLTRLTHHDGTDTHPRWSPDGKSIVFVSDREGTSQLFRLAVDGGEAERLSDFPTGVSSPEWSPDGKKVLFTSKVFPELGAQAKKTQERLDQAEENPVKAHIADDLLYRHWTAYADGRRTHVLSLDVARKKITDLTPGDFDTPSFRLGSKGFALSPDGRELCVTSNREPPENRAHTTNKDLWVIALRKGKPVGEPQNLTPDNPAFDGTPVYSPDGSAIAFRRQALGGYEADRFRLAVYDRTSGETRVLTESFDNWVGTMAWTSDSKSLVFQADVKGRNPLFQIEVATGKITDIDLPSAHSWSIDSRGELVFAFSKIGTPVELYTADKAGTGVRRLTGFNRKIAKRYDIRPGEELWVDGPDGHKIHTFVVKPHGFKSGKTYPLVLNVHGGPQSQWNDKLRGDWQVYPGAGYVVAFSNPRGSTGYGQAFTAAISKDWGGGVYRDLMAVTDTLAELPYVDAERMGAMGWSYGGYMMNWFLGHTTKFKAIGSMMGIYDLHSFYGATEELWFPEWDLGGPPWGNRAAYAKHDPALHADKFQTPTLVITGELDYRVPYTQSLQLFTALRRQGVPSRLVVFPNDGHWPSYVKSMPLYYAAHLDWFHTYLGGAKSTLDPQALVRGDAFGK